MLVPGEELGALVHLLSGERPQVSILEARASGAAPRFKEGDPVICATTGYGGSYG